MWSSIKTLFIEVKPGGTLVNAIRHFEERTFNSDQILWGTDFIEIGW